MHIRLNLMIEKKNGLSLQSSKHNLESGFRMIKAYNSFSISINSSVKIKIVENMLKICVLSIIGRNEHNKNTPASIAYQSSEYCYGILTSYSFLLRRITAIRLYLGKNYCSKCDQAKIICVMLFKWACLCIAIERYN